MEPETENNKRMKALKSPIDDKFKKSAKSEKKDGTSQFLTELQLEETNDILMINKKRKEYNPANEESFNSTDKDPGYFLVCYDPLENEIYFTEFIKEKIVCRDKNYMRVDQEEKYANRIKFFSEKWATIKTLSKLEQEDFLSERSQNYFKKPINSKFLFPEKLGLINFNSSYPLPPVFLEIYSNVQIKITIHSSVIGVNVPETERVIDTKVPFYKVVDTIIKDAMKNLIAKFHSNIENEINKELYEDLLAKFNIIIKDRRNKFVLKFKYFEEYMYGDYPICSYESMRGMVREYETVNLILMKYDVDEVQPNISHYPPIIYVPPEKEFNYYTLLQQYMDLFTTECGIIYRMKPDLSLHEYYAKNCYDRKEKLVKYCESGECDFPFTFNIKGIKNLFSLKHHIDSKHYNETEMDLPYFNLIPSLDSIRNKKNLFQKITSKIFGKLYKKKSENKDKEKEEKQEQHDHQKLLRQMMKKYKLNLGLMDEMNYLKVGKTGKLQKKKQEQTTMSFLLNNIKYSKNILDRIKNLSIDHVNDPLKLKIAFPISDNQSSLMREGTDGIKVIDDTIENFSMKNYKLPFLPVFIKIEVILLYGSYEIQKLHSRYFMVNDDININEKINFSKLLVSHLPRETRISINLLAFDKYQSKPFVLGSCSTPIYDEYGMMMRGTIELFLWPLFSIDPRIVCCYPYMGKYFVAPDERSSLNFDKKNYTILYIEMPKFPRPVAYVLKTPQSYKEFLKLKHPKKSDNVNTTYEIKVLYGTSMNHLEYIMDTLKDRDRYFLELETKRKESREKGNLRVKRTFEMKEDDLNIIENKSENIWNLLDTALPLVKDLIHKDPLYKLEIEEREIILYCRDYICEIPSALEVFLRSIDWLDPLQVNLARVYLKKWERIDPEDAISLLDARFPDTSVREYAISVLTTMTDDLMYLYMLQLCQCLIYEPYLNNPLSDFLIEKSIKSPNLIGVSFFWNATVSSKNRLFRERLSVYVAQMLMLTGPNFLETIEKSFFINESLRKIGLEAKESYRKLPDSEKKNVVKKNVKQGLTDLKMSKFTMPIHPSYFVKSFVLEECSIFSSKMVPIKIACRSSEDSTYNVIFKSGDDLRQDVLTLQILKIMDKMWLDNDLDLKIVTYKVQPTSLKEGFIEFVDASVIDGLQMKEGYSGALDRELLIKHLRNVGQPPNQPPKYESHKQYENFVNSLAGFCVATCVLGIGDRHPGNVMVKDNGIFFHIDYGHFLGNFKYKFGFKRERAPFLLTPDMAHVYTKNGKEEHFKNSCVKAYNILRKNASRLMNLFIIMSSAGIFSFFNF